MIWLVLSLAALAGALGVLLVIALLMFAARAASPRDSAWSALWVALGIGAAFAVAVTALVVLAVQA